MGDMLEFVTEGQVRQAQVTNVLGKWVQVEGGIVLAPGEWKLVREANHR